MSHTQGKLVVSEFGVGFEIADEQGRIIAQTQQLCAIKNAGDHDERKANARRIKACWNASIGIPTKELEAAADGRLLNIFEGLISERDELLAALKDILSELEPAGSDGWMAGNVHQDEYNAARAAIARAEKGGA
jgi:hypothetical protein